MTAQIIEYTAVFFNLMYLILLMRENIWCWLFGIIGSGLSVILFYQSNLYSETILYLFYVVIGFYGWYIWYNKGRKKAATPDYVLDEPKSEEVFVIQRWKLSNHLLAIVVGVLCAFGVGYTFNRFSDASNPFVDATTTVFSFIASYLQAHKILYSWIYWIIINATTIWLYWTKELTIYSILMIVYLVLSFVGLREWYGRFKQSIVS